MSKKEEIPEILFETYIDSNFSIPYLVEMDPDFEPFVKLFFEMIEKNKSRYLKMWEEQAEEVGLSTHLIKKYYESIGEKIRVQLCKNFIRRYFDYNLNGWGKEVEK